MFNSKSILEKIIASSYPRSDQSLELCDLLIQENLPLTQEAGLINVMGTEKMNDASSFKEEELVHDVIEAHEAKEAQAQDKNEASEITEITIAGCSSTEQVNYLKS